MSAPADNAPVSELSAENSLGLMPDIVPPVIDPKVALTDSWVGSSETQSMSGRTNAPDPFVLAAARKDRLPDQPDLDSWDSLYADVRGVVKSAEDNNWDNLYFDAHGVMRRAGDNNWDNFYFDAHGVMRRAGDNNWDGLFTDAHGMGSTWDQRWETLDDNVPSPPQNGLNHDAEGQ